MKSQYSKRDIVKYQSRHELDISKYYREYKIGIDFKNNNLFNIPFDFKLCLNRFKENSIQLFFKSKNLNKNNLFGNEGLFSFIDFDYLFGENVGKDFLIQIKNKLNLFSFIRDESTDSFKISDICKLMNLDIKIISENGIQNISMV